ncbi:xanthine dehydrogenase family protein molybdopterin-binding subunit [Bartonella sp. LJL80]
MKTLNTTRRRFLQLGGILLVSNALPTIFQQGKALAADASTTASLDIPLDRVSSFIAIGADGKVTAFNGHVDLGTGTRTALAQIIADELSVDFADVTMVLGDTARTPDQGPTIASATIQVSSIPMRQAAAQVKQLLLKFASESLKMPIGQLTAKNGRVISSDGSGADVGYGELITGKDLMLPLDDKITLTTDYHYIGKPVNRVDIPAKVTGGASYVHDVRLPGMLHGRVVRPPFAGADSSAPYGNSLVSIDESSIAHIDGIVKLVVIKDFIGIVAQREEQAIAAMRSLKVTWKDWYEIPDLSPEGLHQTLIDVKKNPRQLRKDDGADQAYAQAKVQLDRDYVWPYQAHASIGPSCAVADYTGDIVTVWSGTQNPHDLRKDIAHLLGFDVHNVIIHREEASGCYGRNCADDVSADAVLLSKAVGKPVRVQLMREQEFGWEPKGTGQLIRIRGGLDESHKVTAYHMRTCYPSNNAITLPLLLTGVVPNKADVQQMGDRTAICQYEYPKMDVVCEDTAPIVRASWLRGVSALPNVFAHESWIDEAAYLAQEDPIAYRLRYLHDQRAIDMIEALKKRVDWQDGPRFAKGRQDAETVSGRGFAYARYFHSKFPGFGAAWAAWVVDLQVNKISGRIKIDKISVAHDCGLMINPNGVKHQVHGNIIQSTGRILKEYVTFNKTSVTSLEWGGYPILRFDELPEIDILLLDRPQEPSMGAGESASVPSAAAIANAVFDAVGIRLTEVPFTPDRVLKALHDSSQDSRG